MSRKNFVAIAKAIRESTNQDGYISPKVLIDELSMHFRSENQNFDADRFNKACQ